MTQRAAYAPGLFLRPILDALGRSGVDVPQLLRRSAIDAAAIGDSRARIPIASLRELWKQVSSVEPDQAFGLRAAECTHAGTFGLFGYIAKSSASGHDAIRRMRRYRGMLAGDDSGALVLEGDRAVLKQVHLGRVPRILSDFALAAAVKLGRQFYAEALPLLEVRISYAEPPDADKYPAYFGVPVLFGCGYNAIVLRASALDARHKDADETLCAILERQADETLRQWSTAQTLAQRATRALTEQLPRGEASVRQLAKRLAMSERTLRRKLQQEGTSHARLLDDLRRRLALQQLEAGRPLQEITRTLGFAQPSAFCRAFKRWTGATPTQWLATRTEARVASAR